MRINGERLLTAIFILVSGLSSLALIVFGVGGVITTLGYLRGILLIGGIVSVVAIIYKLLGKGETFR